MIVLRIVALIIGLFAARGAIAEAPSEAVFRTVATTRARLVGGKDPWGALQTLRRAMHALRNDRAASSRAESRDLLAEAEELAGFTVPVALAEQSISDLERNRVEVKAARQRTCAYANGMLAQIEPKFSGRPVVEQLGRRLREARCDGAAAPLLPRASSASSDSPILPLHELKYQCKRRCETASTNCRYSCACGCNTDTPPELCAQRCESCRVGCEQGEQFCKSACE